MHARRNGRIGVVLALGYLAVVVGVEAARRSGWGRAPENLSSSPARVASGQLWQLVTSGFVVAGSPLVQLAIALLLIVTVLARLGAATFLRAAFAGQIVATLVVYFGVGVLWVLERKDVDAVVDAPDYGISCVIAAAAGVLVTGAGWRRRWSAGLAAAALLAAAWSFATSRDGLAGSEHLLAFALGGLVGRRAHRQAAARGTVRPAAARKTRRVRRNRAATVVAGELTTSATDIQNRGRVGPPKAEARHTASGWAPGRLVGSWGDPVAHRRGRPGSP